MVRLGSPLSSHGGQLLSYLFGRHLLWFANRTHSLHGRNKSAHLLQP